jgi:hypothetical protein
MFGIVIAPFWLVISVLYFGLGVFHLRLSKRVNVDIEFPGKDNIFGVGESAEVQEKEHRDIAHLTRRTLRFAAGGFFVAFFISLYQSISPEQWQIALDSVLLVVIVAAVIIAALIAVYLLIYLK